MSKALVEEREQEERGEPQTVWPDAMQREGRGWAGRVSVCRTLAPFQALSLWRQLKKRVASACMPPGRLRRPQLTTPLAEDLP